METRPTAASAGDAQPAPEHDLLWRQLKSVPAFRALLRSVEARFYRRIELQPPILDLGCGDGHFAQMTFADPLFAGVDPWWGPLQKASHSGVYRFAIQSMGNALPFPDAYFKSVISNSVLEHITEVQEVLDEANRILQPGGKLVVTMPSHYFTEWLGGATLLENVGLSGMADQYRHLFNYIARHVHTDSPADWALRLASSGFAVERWQYYFSRQALWTLEWGHLQGLPSAVMHFLTGHWIVAPWASSLRRTEQWVRPFYEEEIESDGAYMLIVSRKRSNDQVQPYLPDARPFDISEPALLPGEDIRWQQQLVAMVDDQVYPVPDLPDLERPLERKAPEPEITPDPTLLPARSSLISGSLIGLCLMFAAIGQSILGGVAAEPASGMRWYGLSLVTLAALAWSRKPIRLPALPRPTLSPPRQIPRQRWLYIVALLLALWAQRFANDVESGPSPGLAVFLWMAAAAVAFYALNDKQPIPYIHIPRLDIDFLAIPVFFFFALVLRAIKLTQHPFILNGAEASIGLDALNFVKGASGSPFAVGWLTNPTLPLLILSIPLKLLGPTVLGIRLLSPVVGAATVVVTYLFGRKFWGREVGLLAAILLAGSHFHLQYSRLGMTNVWEPLVLLITFGFLGIAWVQSAESSRWPWLWAGVLVGLNVYFFTNSRLLPLMLLVIFVLIFVSHRHRLMRQGRHIVAAAAVALVIAMPQLIYYGNHATVFMERANNLGILAGQSDWLTQQAQRTGQSQAAVLRMQFLNSLLAFNLAGDHSPSYKPGVPLLGFGPAILFVIGLAISAYRWRQEKHLILVVWVAIVMVFAGALLIETPSSHRLVIAAPALCLLGAIAMVELGRQVKAGLTSEPMQELARQYLLPAMVIISLLFTLNDTLFYFGRYQNQHTFGDRNTEIADAMADYLNSLPGEWTAYFHGPPSMYVGFPTLPFLAPDYRAGDNLYDVIAPDSETPPPATPNFVHIYLPERSGEIDLLRGLYPEGQLRTFEGYFANPLFYAYAVQE